MNFCFVRCRALPFIGLITFLLVGCGGADSGGSADINPPPVQTGPTDPAIDFAINFLGSPKEISNDGAGSISSAKIYLDDREADEMAIATPYVLWTHNDGVKDKLSLSRYAYAAANDYWDDLSSEYMQNANGDVGSAELVVDEDGSLTVIWSQESGGRYDLWAQHYDVFVRGWRPASLVEGNDLGDAGMARLVVESQSRYVVATWLQSNGSVNQLWANRYRVDIGGNWEGSERIDTDVGTVEGLELVIDEDNTTTAIWRQSDGVRMNLWANRRDASGGWGSAVKIDTEDLGDVFEPLVAIDGAGNINVVWVQESAGRMDLWAARYSTSGINLNTWVVSRLETGSGDVSEPQMVVDDSGNVTVVWLQRAGFDEELWANRLQNDTWTGATEIGGVGSASTPKLVLDNSERITVAWEQDSGFWNDIWANRYVAGVGWDGAQNIGSPGNGLSELSHLLVDRFGEVTAIWMDTEGANVDLWANRYSLASGWAQPATVENFDEGVSGVSIAGMDRNGIITLVWNQLVGGENHLLTSTYVPNTGSWSEASKLQAEGHYDAFDPLLVVEFQDSGTTAVWKQLDDGDTVLWGTHF